MHGARLMGIFAPPMKASTEKAVSGPGFYTSMYNDPIWTRKKDPTAFFRQAQNLYHSHPWVGTAENTISTRVASVRWHLEDDNDDEVTDESPENYRVVRDLLEKPLGDVRALIAELGFKPASPSTGRELKKLTVRHMGLCGIGFWYLDQLDGYAKTPQRIFYLNPARLTPAMDKGGNLVGWVLDAQDDRADTGTPLDLDEVLPLPLDPPDWGHYGTGWVERMLVKAQLTDLADRHGGGVLATGGRLAGTVTPKDASTWLNDEQFEGLVTAFRAINEHPDATKRTLVLRGAVEFAPNSANPEELQLVEFAKMGRDDILAGAGVPYSQVGGTSPAGFGGEVRSAEEAALWAGACGPRLDALMEHVQFGLLDRWKLAGVNVELKDSRPSFDDDKPKYETAALARVLPMRNDERRALVGLDPFDDDELNAEVWIPSDLVRIDLPPEPKVTPPQLLPFTGQTEPPMPPMDDEPSDNLPEPVKASMTWTPAMRKSVQKVLDAQRVEIAGKVRDKASHLIREPKDTSVWWNGSKWDEALTKALTPYAEAIAESTHAKVSKQLASRKKSGKADGAVARILASIAKRVKGINETTRDAIRNLIEQHALTPGIGAQELGQFVEEAASFDPYRAEMVARTESAHFLNESQLATFEEFGVEEVEAIDGDDDPECAERNGNIYSLEEAQSIEDHPNGTLDWAPVLKAAPDPLVEMMALVRDSHQTFGKAFADFAGMRPPEVNNYVTVPERTVNVHVPDQPAPVVKAGDVTVNVPEQKPPTVNVQAAKASLVQDIRIVDMPRQSLKVRRDLGGRITEVEG